MRVSILLLLQGLPSCLVRITSTSILGHFGPLKKTEVTRDRSDQGTEAARDSLCRCRRQHRRH